MSEALEFSEAAFGYLLGIMKTLEITVSKNEGIMVHSHTGTRRPAIVICCWFVYSGQFRAKKAIEFFAEKRLKGNTKKLKCQIKFISQFEQGNL